MHIEAETLDNILPRCKEPEVWAFALSEILDVHGIETFEQTASFIAQTGHESAHYNVLEENLNYSMDGLLRVFGKYFSTPEIANEYARKPQMIANRVYGGRMGNGPEQTGDGWRYRGRGIIQLTGKRNYAACSKALFNDENFLLDEPNKLFVPEIAVEAACWFWNANKLNDYCMDVVKTTRIVNGGENGLDDRKAIYERALNYL